MDELTKLLAEAAQKLGFEAARIWPQIVMITFIKSLFWLITYPLLSGGSALAAWRYWSFVILKTKEIRESDRYTPNDDEMALYLIGVVITTIAIITTAASIANLPDVLVGVLAPEAQTVLDMIKEVR